MTLSIRTLASVILVGACFTVPVAAQLQELPPSAVYGDYAVGSALGFAVDDQQRFDPWTAAYASPRYRELVRAIEATGQRRTVVFHLWYPAAAAASAERIAGPRSPLPAAGGRRATFLDFFFGDQAVGQALSAGLPVDPNLLHVPGGTLADADGATQGQVFAELGRRFVTAPRGAWLDAAPAEGRFPLIVLAHGLAGSHSMWSTLGEFLASHGYVVAAPTFISDGGLPLVFHDPDSPFAAAKTTAEVQRAYQTIFGEFKVVPYFYRLLFGMEEDPGFGPPEGFDPAAAGLVPGGVERATTMMQNLFRQRVADVALLIRTLRLLGAETATCRTSLASLGATAAARELCGLLAGRIDGGKVGVAGHSLGSMTAQLAANHVPGVSAAFGLNNAPPFTWTPEEMFGAGERDGLPVGSRQPVLQLIGDEDAFVQGVFVGLFQSTVAAAGGDPAAAFPLAAERAAPERIDNPQPVALSGWLRAAGDRGLVIVRDTNHVTLAEEFARQFPWPEFRRGNLPFAMSPERSRKPTGAAAFGPPGAPGESYAELGWAAVATGEEVYLPHVIRDWYARAWFDWYLKGDRDARRRLLAGDPFGALTSVRMDLR